MSNPNDVIRQQILQYFYDRNTMSTSEFGKKGSAVKISDVKRDLKARHKLTQQQVVSNLTYLIDRGWVKKITQAKTITVRGGVNLPSEVIWYAIAAPGIDKIEGGSEFKPADRFAGINITASGSNVITLGDGNVVNVRYEALHKALDELKAAVTSSSRLSEGEKLDVASDIESVKDQLVKVEPNRGVVRALWTGIKTTVTAMDFAEHARKVGELIGPLVG